MVLPVRTNSQSVQYNNPPARTSILSCQRVNPREQYHDFECLDNTLRPSSTMPALPREEKKNVGDSEGHSKSSQFRAGEKKYWSGANRGLGPAASGLHNLTFGDSCVSSSTWRQSGIEKIFVFLDQIFSTMYSVCGKLSSDLGGCRIPTTFGQFGQLGEHQDRIRAIGEISLDHALLLFPS